MRSTANTTANPGRTVAGTAPAGPVGERTTGGGTVRRSAAGSGTGTVTRPSLGSIGGREKTKTGGTGGDRKGVGTGGWAGYQAEKAERTQRYPTLDIDKEAVLIRFAEGEPFAFIYRHWVNKRPYTCIGEECPLCERGHRAKPVVFYNVITVSDATLRVWEMSSEPTGKVKKQYDKLVGQDKTLDDPGVYFIVSKAKKENNFFEYEVELVKARDLEEDYGIEPMGSDEIEHAMRRGPFTDEIIFVNTKAELREVAEKLSDDDD